MLSDAGFIISTKSLERLMQRLTFLGKNADFS